MTLTSEREVKTHTHWSMTFLPFHLISGCLCSRNSEYIWFLKHTIFPTLCSCLIHISQFVNALLVSLLITNSFCPFKFLLKYHLFSEGYSNYLVPHYVLSKYVFIYFLGYIISHIFIYIFKNLSHFIYACTFISILVTSNMMLLEGRDTNDLILCLFPISGPTLGIWK